MEDYCYEPLSNGHAIRLAVIHPSEFEDSLLELSLYNVPFMVDSPPQYEALSYCWGSAQNPQDITIATPSKGILRVTQNLAVALRHLRFRDQPHTMWIDAICINQSDNVEKGYQVAIMGQIYLLAASVVVWLGPQADASDRAMGIMNFLGRQVEVDFVYSQMKPSIDAEYPSVADKSTSLLLDDKDLCTIYHLFSRPWFERLWVRQEIFLANPSAYVLCGPHFVSWPTFRKSWFCIQSKNHRDFQFSTELSDRMELLRGFLFQKTRINLFDLRVNLGEAKCQDPRDRIYAVLQMLNNTYRSWNIVPDYNKSAIQVYTEVALEYLKHSKDANIFTECQPRPGASRITWVPDWSVEDDTLNYWGVCYASGPIASRWTLIEAGVLRMVGVSAGVIEGLHTHCVTRHSNNQSTLPEIRRLLLENGIVVGNTCDDNLVKAYARTLCLDMFEDHIPMASLPTFAESIDSLRQIISGVPSSSELRAGFDTSTVKFLNRCRSYLPGRQILVTKAGNIGLASASARVGDEICVFLGCDSPMLLRPESGRRYIVVGECYLSSAQFGESILGDLQQGVHLTNRWNEHDNEWERCFKDNSSGHVFYEDTRLQAVVEDYTEYCRQLQGNPTRRWSVDPDVLRKAGVKLRDFDLI